jgi:hypothetical protein
MGELILPFFLSALIGGGLGGLSAYHSRDFAKLFYSGVSLFVGLNMILWFFAPMMASFGIGDGTSLGLLGETFLALPKHLQWAMVSLPAVFFAARMAGLYYRAHIYAPPPETEAQRRGRRLIRERG